MINAKEYGKALFELSVESGTVEGVKADCQLLKKLLSENPDYKKLLDSPAVAKEERLGLIDSALSALGERLCNLLKILSEKHEVHSIDTVLDGFWEAHDLANSIERVEAVTAIPLTKEQIKALTLKLEAKTGKTVIIRNTIDKSILGGIKLRYLGIQLDGSVKTRLESFEKNLKNIVI